MISFTKRCLKVFFKDKTSVFFSLLSVIIIISLYALFLGNAWTRGSNIDGIRQMMDMWIMAGIVAVTTLTSTMGALGTIVDDKVKKIEKDFSASPVSRASIFGGYVLASLVVGVILSVVALAFSQMYATVNGAKLLQISEYLKLLGIIVLSTAVNASIVLVYVSMIKTMSAFGTGSTILGTIIGFLMGIYVPIGELPKGMQTVIKLFPPSHTASLMRQISMQSSIENVFKGAPKEVLTENMEQLGVIFNINGHIVTPLQSILYLVVTGVVFSIISILILSKKKVK